MEEYSELSAVNRGAHWFLFSLFGWGASERFWTVVCNPTAVNIGLLTVSLSCVVAYIVQRWFR